MAEYEAPAGLRKRWSALRSDLLFLPALDRMKVEPHQVEFEAVEFVRVAPVDEEIMVPSAPSVSTADVREYEAWSEAEADQQRMWALVGTAIEGSRETRTCPECGGAHITTCGHCGGDGRTTCVWCHGFGDKTCMSCGGSGRRSVLRTQTNADGTTSTTTEWESCMSCGGDGRERCSSCSGSGQVTCSTCGGDGRLVCQTCCPAGTVDIYIRRSFAAHSVVTHILPVRLPEYPGPVRLSPGHVQIEFRPEATPLDAEADRAELEQRDLPAPDARLFFVRKAAVVLHSVYDIQSGQLAASFIDGEPEPLLTIHRTVQDPAWTPDRERYKALGATLLYVLGPLALGGLMLAHQAPIGVGLALAALVGAFLLNRHPLRAARLAFLDVRCLRHGRSAPMRCPACGKDLCHECLQPSLRCPHCGQVASEAVTHVIEDGQWAEVKANT